MVKAATEQSQHFLPASHRRASDILPTSFYLLRRRSGRSSPDLIAHMKRPGSDKKWISQRLVNGFVPILLNIQISVCCREQLRLLSQQVRLSAAQPSKKQLLREGSQLSKKHPRLHKRLQMTRRLETPR